MSRLVFGRTNHGHKNWICDYCLHPFSSQRVLDAHLPNCKIHKPQSIVFPEPGSCVEFLNTKREMPVPFVIYVDFESFLKPADHERGTHTRVCDTHEPSGFCCYRASRYPEYCQEPYTYSGPGGMERFFEHIMQESRSIARILGKNVPMSPLTDDELRQFQDADKCRCGRSFDNKNRKVRHHDHLTGEFICALCNKCNLQLKLNKRKRRYGSDDGDDYLIPIIAHNMRGYDSHHMIKNFRNKYVEYLDENGDICHNGIDEVIPSNTEKFISFSIGKLRFIDSCQFLNASLDSLTLVLLKSGREKFPNTMK